MLPSRPDAAAARALAAPHLMLLAAAHARHLGRLLGQHRGGLLGEQVALLDGGGLQVGVAAAAAAPGRRERDGLRRRKARRRGLDVHQGRVWGTLQLRGGLGEPRARAASGRQPPPADASRREKQTRRKPSDRPLLLLKRVREQFASLTRQ